MNQEIIATFQKSTSDVFGKMLGIAITSGDAVPCDQMLTRCGVSGVIGLAGDLSGDVIVSFEERVAILATAGLLGQEPTELNNDVVDAVGELTNMIAGSAKCALQEYNMSLALPTVILGAEHRIAFKSGVRPISIPFDSEWGAFSIALGLCKVEAQACPS